MWHASGKGFAGGDARQIALRALQGVGDAGRGEWEQASGHGVWHIRRRLRDPEEGMLLVVRDIRGSLEEQRRLQVVWREVPALRGRRVDG